jgi:hypothetical protein
MGIGYAQTVKVGKLFYISGSMSSGEMVTPLKPFMTNRKDFKGLSKWLRKISSLSTLMVLIHQQEL